MLASDPPAWDTALQIKQIEHECDALTHDIIQRLNKTFVTPIDREDIHALATSLDDVMDAIDAAANVVHRFRMSSVRYGARELASLVLAVGDAGAGGGRGAREEEGRSRTRGRGQPPRKRGGRRAQRGAAAALRGRTQRHHRHQVEGVFDLLEEATDRCEDVANVLEGVVVKHG